MPAAVIFDMDGIIIDSEPLWRRAMIKMFTKHGLPFSDERSRHTTGMRIDHVISFWNNHSKFTEDEALVRQDIEDHLCELILAEGQAMRGLHTTLELIKKNNLPVGLATSSSHKLIESVLSVLCIKDYFQYIQSAEHLQYGKPHPEVFLKCAEALHVNPHHCLVIEDSLNGLIAAKAAGMKVIAVPEEHNSKNPKLIIADQILGSLETFDQSVLDKF